MKDKNISLKEISFADLYEEYWKLLYEIAFAKTGDRQDAFDVVQDLFIYIEEHKESIYIVTSLKAYLLTCLRNIVFDHFRRNRIRDKVVQDFYRFADVDVLNETEMFAVEVLKKNAEQAIQNAVDELPEKMRYIVRQRWYHKKTIADISAELSISTKTVKNNLSIALQLIRKYADENGIEILFLLPIIFTAP